MAGTLGLLVYALGAEKIIGTGRRQGAQNSFVFLFERFFWDLFCLSVSPGGTRLTVHRRLLHNTVAGAASWLGIRLRTFS